MQSTSPYESSRRKQLAPQDSSELLDCEPVREPATGPLLIGGGTRDGWSPFGGGFATSTWSVYWRDGRLVVGGEFEDRREHEVAESSANRAWSLVVVDAGGPFDDLLDPWPPLRLERTERRFVVRKVAEALGQHHERPRSTATRPCPEVGEGAWAASPMHDHTARGASTADAASV